MAEREDEDKEAGEPESEASLSAPGASDEGEESEQAEAPRKRVRRAKARAAEPEREEAEEAEASGERAEDEEEEDGDRTADEGELEDRPDAAAARVAEALGLDDGGEAPPEDAAAEEEGVRNRAVRRREEALERRRKKKAETKDPVASRAKPKAEDDEPLPKDKNARAKELLRRRREEAAGRRPVDLLPGEMVDDALSRMASSSSRFIRENFAVIQWVVAGALVVGAGVLGWTYMGEKSAAAASSALAAAVADERGKVMAEDKRGDDEKEFDTAKIFKTVDEREDKALTAYNQVVDKYAGTGPAILAKLGQAGVYLDKKDFQHALDAYTAVLATQLAAADPDVKGRAIEGIAFAKEGKADLDGALASFKELEGIDVKPYKELSLYHQARILLAKGDKDKAKDLLKSAREKLSTSGVADGHPFQFLEAVVDDTLRKIDPTAVPARSQIGGAKGSQMSPEELQKIMKQAQEAAERRAKEHGP